MSGSTSQPKRIIITGANSGIGKAMALDLAEQGHHLTLACRSKARGEAALEEIRDASGNDEVELELCDVGKPQSVRDFAERIKKKYSRIDVLMNNAGVYMPERIMTDDGFEMMFAINHLGPYLLTHLLWRELAGGRVVTTSSMGHMFARYQESNLQGEAWFGSMYQYGLTKLANILFTRELAKRGARSQITAHCFHPGMVGTEFAQDQDNPFGSLVKLTKGFLRTPKKGAETGVFLATAPEADEHNGEYWVDCKVRWATPTSRNPEHCANLWRVSGRLLGIRPN